jgi:hypothetical protein
VATELEVVFRCHAMRSCGAHGPQGRPLMRYYIGSRRREPDVSYALRGYLMQVQPPGTEKADEVQALRG